MPATNRHGQPLVEAAPADVSRLATRIMYVENKATGAARIARVHFSRSGRTIYVHGRKLATLKGRGFKSNYVDVEDGTHYWVSGPKRRGGNRLYGGDAGVVVDEDVAEAYQAWLAERPGSSTRRQTP